MESMNVIYDFREMLICFLVSENSYKHFCQTQAKSGSDLKLDLSASSTVRHTFTFLKAIQFVVFVLVEGMGYYEGPCLRWEK